MHAFFGGFIVPPSGPCRGETAADKTKRVFIPSSGVGSRASRRRVSPPSPYAIIALALLGLASVASLLGGLDASGVRLGSNSLASELLHQTTAGLERSGEVALGLLAPDVQFGRVRLEDRLDRHHGLDEQGLSVLHVAVLVPSVIAH